MPLNCNNLANYSLIDADILPWFSLMEPWSCLMMPFYSLTVASPRYESTWRQEEKEKKRKLRSSAVWLCGEGYSSYCHTQAFFLTPTARKTGAGKGGSRTPCRIL